MSASLEGKRGFFFEYGFCDDSAESDIEFGFLNLIS